MHLDICVGVDASQTLGEQVGPPRIIVFQPVPNSDASPNNADHLMINSSSSKQFKQLTSFFVSLNFLKVRCNLAPLPP